ncbi:hypothetical protein ACIBEJ_18120 [Nonomuraea sp. NPDC050790]|uniref:hypothetical protein n=1 Tax=Nonomuraea sp. NPDC050790 TaxID=3364371 RepID=UPI0037A3CAFD
MRKILWALAGAGLLVVALVIHSHGREPGPAPVPRTETTIGHHELPGTDLVVDADGPVRLTVVAGGARRIVIKRELSWTGGRRHEEAWEDARRLRIAYACDDGCAADYVLTVPDATRVRVAGAARGLTCAARVTCTEE